MCLILTVFGFLGNLDMLFIALMILFHDDLVPVCLFTSNCELIFYYFYYVNSVLANLVIEIKYDFEIIENL